jgi:hypothetical protein
MAQKPHGIPNPRRVAAGRLNRAKCRGITDAGRQRLRDAAFRNSPWLRSTGPRTAAGKARVAANGKAKQVDEVSRREVQRELAGVDDVIRRLAAIRRQVCGGFD